MLMVTVYTWYTIWTTYTHLAELCVSEKPHNLE
jgi:hypothetical protein